MSHEAKEIAITLKDSEKSLTQKFLHYDDLSVSYEDQSIRDYIKEAQKSFDGSPESITVKVKLVVL
jgi:hypothetical protein